jgi:hypothetical protein
MNKRKKGKTISLLLGPLPHFWPSSLQPAHSFYRTPPFLHDRARLHQGPGGQSVDVRHITDLWDPLVRTSPFLARSRIEAMDAAMDSSRFFTWFNAYMISSRVLAQDPRTARPTPPLIFSLPVQIVRRVANSFAAGRADLTNAARNLAVHLGSLNRMHSDRWGKVGTDPGYKTGPTAPWDPGHSRILD